MSGVLTAACLTSRAGDDSARTVSWARSHFARHNLHPQVASSNPEDWIAGQQLPNIALVRFADSTGSGSLQTLAWPAR